MTTLTATPFAPTVGQRVAIPALGLTDAEVIAVVPNSAGGETKYRVRWFEAALNNAERAANFWASDLVWEAVEYNFC